MAAGLGFKTFTTGEVLTSTDTNGYLMQGVLVFADAVARTAAITSPQEGQTSYLKDTDVIQVYSGSAWVTKSGGASPLTTKGDLYGYSTTDARIAVGTNGQVLTADSTAATGVAWASAGAYRTLINTGGTALSGSSTTVSSIPSTYTDLIVVITGWQTASDSYHYLYCNSDQTAANYGVTAISSANGAASTLRGGTLTDSMGNGTYRSGNSTGMCVVTIYNYANAFRKNLQYNSAFNIDVVPGVMGSVISNVAWNATAAISSLTFKTTAGTYSAGTIYVYGAN